MADITMCLNPTCPLADTCYRKQAIPNEHGQWADIFEYTIANGGIKCDNYWPAGESAASDKTEVMK